MKEDLDAFYAEHPEHIAGIRTRATSAKTGESVSGHMLDSESLRAFFAWLVGTGRKPRAGVERVWLLYHAAAPEDFPLPFPWEGKS